MGKIISVLFFIFLLYLGVRDLITYFQNPEFVEITMAEIDSLGTEGLEYVHITDGLSMGDYVYSQSEKSGTIMGIKYALLNKEKIFLPGDSNKVRTKVIVKDSKQDSIGFGIQDIKGKISGKLDKEDGELMRQKYHLDDDYIVIKNGWEKPSLWWSLGLIIVPGLLLMFNLRNFVGGSSNNPNQGLNH